jgi:RNA polymerase sigma factor (TIGR02999 family)
MHQPDETSKNDAPSPEAAELLSPEVYDQLRGVAERFLNRERVGHTLQATALVHEAFIRLDNHSRVQWQNEAHFCAVASIAMRRILVNHARGKQRLKRGGEHERVSLTLFEPGAEDPGFDVLALHEALEELTGADPRLGRIIEMRAFGGLEVSEVATLMDLSERTVHREWKTGIAWLRARLGAASDDSEQGGDA